MKKAIFMGLVIGAIAIAMVVAGSSSVIPASADKESAQDGLNNADENVHDNTGPLSKQDFAFHEGICQGGHSTDVLDEVTGGEGCDSDAISDPGNSDDNRQDD
jgi:hypothetical protein